MAYYRKNRKYGSTSRTADKRLKFWRGEARKNKKQNKLLKILISIALVALLGVCGWLIYDHVQQNKVETPTTEITTPTDDSLVDGPVDSGSGSNTDNGGNEFVEGEVNGDENNDEGNDETGDA